MLFGRDEVKLKDATERLRREHNKTSSSERRPFLVQNHVGDVSRHEDWQSLVSAIVSVPPHASERVLPQECHHATPAPGKGKHTLSKSLLMTSTAEHQHLGQLRRDEPEVPLVPDRHWYS